MLERLKEATSRAYDEFRWTWEHYDKLAAAHKEVQRLEQAKHEAFTSIFATLGESSKHFIQSFMQNLTLEERPGREQVERFMQEISALPYAAQNTLMQKACAACPKLVTAGAVMKWATTNSAKLVKPTRIAIV